MGLHAGVRGQKALRVVVVRYRLQILATLISQLAVARAGDGARRQKRACTCAATARGLGALLLLAATLWVGMDARAQQSPPPPRFSTSTAAVVVDVVVRDQQHRPVLGLRANDFAVNEDGAPQTITSFDEINTSRGPIAGQANPAADSPAVRADRTTMPAVVALVFEELSPEGRRLAEQAADAFVGDAVGAADYAGVFVVDRAVHAIEPYTNDHVALRKGIHDAALRAGEPLEYVGHVRSAEHGSAKDDVKPDPAVRAFATIDALDQIVASLRPLPGRKAVLLFSEGLALQPYGDVGLDAHVWKNSDDWLQDGRHQYLLKAVERANRAGVSFYTVDAGGLRVAGPNDQHCFGCAPYVGLKVLADETGGTFVENTNDLAAVAHRVAADLHHYYLLGYTSSNPKRDRKYRSIQVKVHRPGLTVLARKGYVASDDGEPPSVRSYEVGPLLALERPEVVNAFPFEAGTLAFPTQEGITHTAVVAYIPADSLTWRGESGDTTLPPPSGEGTEEAHVAVMARIKDARGRPVKYASGRYDLRRRARHAGSGDVLFYRAAALDPGVYTLEVAAYDEPSGRASVRLATIDVRKPAPQGPRVGSVFLARVSSTDKAENTAGDMPEELRIGRQVLVPNLAASAPANTELQFAFLVQTTPQQAERLRASATLMKNGAPLATAPITLPGPDAHGAITYVGHLPADTLTAGTYQLLVSVTDGTVATTRDVLFRIAR